MLELRTGVIPGEHISFRKDKYQRLGIRELIPLKSHVCIYFGRSTCTLRYTVPKFEVVSHTTRSAFRMFFLDIRFKEKNIDAEKRYHLNNSNP